MLTLNVVIQFRASIVVSDETERILIVSGSNSLSIVSRRSSSYRQRLNRSESRDENYGSRAAQSDQERQHGL